MRAIDSKIPAKGTPHTTDSWLPSRSAACAKAGRKLAAASSGRAARVRAAANRGVDVTLILPARNDDFAVGAASRSYYADLLDAGVRIFEFEGGLLHAKTLTLDGELALDLDDPAPLEGPGHTHFSLHIFFA